MQTVWKGTISFGLVSIPVRLVGATEERDISFRQVRRSDGSRVRYRRVAESDGEEVPYSEIAKGYELADGEVVVLSDDDLSELPVASSRAVDVLTFVPFSEIDPTALARAYYAEPTGDAKPYVLLREALEDSGRVAVVKLALRNRERLAVLRPREGVLVVQTMLWPDEVRRPDFRFLDADVELRPQEKAMAESFITAMAGEFEPQEYHDEYREALEALVQAKVEGREITKIPDAEPDTDNVVDLMEALRRSVEAAKASRGQAAAGRASAPGASRSSGGGGDGAAEKSESGSGGRRGGAASSGSDAKPPKSESKPDGSRTALPRAGQSKAGESKAGESKSATSKSATSKSATSKSATSKSATSKSATPKADESKDAGSKTSASRPERSKAAASRPERSKAAAAGAERSKAAASMAARPTAAASKAAAARRAQGAVESVESENQPAEQAAPVRATAKRAAGA